MIDFFYSKQPRQDGAAEEDYEGLEMNVERHSSMIDQLRSTRAQKKNHLNLLYNKFELMASELQLFLIELEDRKNFDLSVLPTHLIVTDKDKHNILEERVRLEEDLTRSMLNDKKKKATQAGLRALKKQFKETVAFYDIYGYKNSKDTSFLKEQEELWKRFLLEYHQLAQQALDAQEALARSPQNANLKDELHFLNDKVPVS